MLIYFHVWRSANSIGLDTVRGAQATYLDSSMHRAICDVSKHGIVRARTYAHVCISVRADLRRFRVIIERRYPISNRMCSGRKRIRGDETYRYSAETRYDLGTQFSIRGTRCGPIDAINGFRWVSLIIPMCKIDCANKISRIKRISTLCYLIEKRPLPLSEI